MFYFKITIENIYFNKVASVYLDNDFVFDKNKNIYRKKRKTNIKFIKEISKQEFDIKQEWLYIFTINDIIVKIGGTRTGLKKQNKFLFMWSLYYRKIPFWCLFYHKCFYI